MVIILQYLQKISSKPTLITTKEAHPLMLAESSTDKVLEPKFNGQVAQTLAKERHDSSKAFGQPKISDKIGKNHNRSSQ